MKKNYIAPETLLHMLEALPLMNASIKNVDSNTDHSIDTGGNAGNGESSDSRRPYNVWDDEEEEQHY